VVAKAKTAVKAVAKKTPLKSSSPKGKGGIFPWVTNEPGSECSSLLPKPAQCDWPATAS
jgi:hypothetical protein